MKLSETIAKGLVLLVLALGMASCCCTGGVDDSPDDTDLNLPNSGHNQGTGGE